MHDQCARATASRWTAVTRDGTPRSRPAYVGDPLTLDPAEVVTPTVRDSAGNEMPPPVTPTTFPIAHLATGSQLIGKRAVVRVVLDRHGLWHVRLGTTQPCARRQPPRPAHRGSRVMVP